MGNAKSAQEPKKSPRIPKQVPATTGEPQNTNVNNNRPTNNTPSVPEYESDSDSSSNYSFGQQLTLPSDPDANYSLLDLPNEILSLLIAHLEAKNDIRSLMFTNKLFVDLVYYSWSRLSLQYDNKLTYHQFLDLPAERLQYLLELDISHCSKMTNALFSQILDKTPNLQVLKMKGCSRLTRPSFVKLGKSFTKFTSIDLRECNAEEIVYGGFMSSCPNLKELAVRASTFDLIFKNKLDPLTITCLNLKTTDKVGHIKQEDLAKFVNLITFKGRLPPLENYDFSALKELENLSLSNEVLQIKFGAPQKIKRLSFTPSEKFDSTAFVELANVVSLKLQHCQYGSFLGNFTTFWFPKLEELKTEFMVNPQELIQRKTLVKLDVPFKTKEDAVAVILANPNLTSFHYRSTLVQDVFTALRSLKKLENLVISQISLYSKTPLKWKRLKTLKSLNIMSGSFKDEWMPVLESIKQMPKLEKLFLTANDGYMSLSDAERIKRFCHQFEGFPKLKVLVLRDSQFYYAEREEELMNIKGLTYADCKRLA